MQPFFRKSYIFQCGKEQNHNYSWLKSSLKAKKNNVNINFVIKDQYFSYFHGIQDAVNEFSCLLIGDELLPA